MALFRTTAPAVEPVTLAECKAQLRVQHDSEDELIAGLIRAAREEVELQTGTALIDQDWRLTLDDWPDDGLVRLRRHPVGEILSVTVFGSDGEGSLVDPASWLLDPEARPARLWLRDRPGPHIAMNGIEIDFRSGYGESGAEVPDLLKRAILQLVAHWYEFRATFGPENQPASIPPGFDRLIAGHRAGRL